MFCKVFTGNLTFPSLLEERLDAHQEAGGKFDTVTNLLLWWIQPRITKMGLRVAGQAVAERAKWRRDAPVPNAGCENASTVLRTCVLSARGGRRSTTSRIIAFPSATWERGSDGRRTTWFMQVKSYGTSV